MHLLLAIVGALFGAVLASHNGQIFAAIVGAMAGLGIAHAVAISRRIESLEDEVGRLRAMLSGDRARSIESAAPNAISRYKHLRMRRQLQPSQCRPPHLKLSQSRRLERGQLNQQALRWIFRSRLPSVASSLAEMRWYAPASWCFSLVSHSCFGTWRNTRTCPLSSALPAWRSEA